MCQSSLTLSQALESNNTFVAGQLDSLRQASSALTTTCSDYDIKTSAFLQMLDTAVESLASKAAEQTAEISELVRAGHKAATEHSQMASNMVNSLQSRSVCSLTVLHLHRLPLLQRTQLDSSRRCKPVHQLRSHHASTLLKPSGSTSMPL